MKTLTTDQVRDMTQSGSPAVINVLDEENFRERHIPGSQNIPVTTSNFASRVEEVAGSKERPVIVYCASTTCDASSKAAKQLELSGFTQVYDYEDGIDAWANANLPIEGSQKVASKR